MSINRPIPADTLAVLKRLADSGDKLCQAIVSLNSREPSGTFTFATRPAASSVPVGTEIWNTDTPGSNFSNGTVWKTLAELAYSANVIRYIGTAAIGRGDGSSAQNAMLFDDAMDSLPPVWGGQCRFYFQGVGPFLWARDHTVGVPIGPTAEPLTFIGSYTQVATFSIDTVTANVLHATVAPGVDYTGYTLRVTTAGATFGLKLPIINVVGNNISVSSDQTLPATFTCEIIKPGAAIVPAGSGFLRSMFGSGQTNTKLSLFGISLEGSNSKIPLFYDMTMDVHGCRFDGFAHFGVSLSRVTFTNGAYLFNYTVPGVIDNALDLTGVHFRRFNTSSLTFQGNSQLSGTLIFTESARLVLTQSIANLSTFVSDSASGNAITVQSGSNMYIYSDYNNSPVPGRIKGATAAGILVDGSSVAGVSGIDISSCANGIVVKGMSSLSIGDPTYGFPTSTVNNTAYGLSLANGCVAHIGTTPAASPLNGATGNSIVSGTAKTWGNNTTAGGSTVNGAHIDAD